MSLALTSYLLLPTCTSPMSSSVLSKILSAVLEQTTHFCVSRCFLNFGLVLWFGFLRHGFSVALAVLDQAGLQLRDLPASASQVLELKVCITPYQFKLQFFSHIIVPSDVTSASICASLCAHLATGVEKFPKVLVLP